MFQLALGWQNSQDDALFEQTGEFFIKELSTFAKTIGSNNDYIYLPYAHKSQNPLASYGAGNVEKIKRAAEIYDPTGVFQHMVPGGFKVSAASSTEKDHYVDAQNGANVESDETYDGMSTNDQEHDEL